MSDSVEPVVLPAHITKDDVRLISNIVAPTIIAAALETLLDENESLRRRHERNAVTIEREARRAEHAEALIEAVRAIHHEKRGVRLHTGIEGSEEHYAMCVGCSADWPCATIRALTPLTDESRP